MEVIIHLLFKSEAYKWRKTANTPCIKHAYQCKHNCQRALAHIPSGLHSDALTATTQKREQWMNHRKHLTNQGLSRSRSYQPPSPLIRPAGRWSQPQVKLKLSVSVVFTAPFLPFSIGKIHYKWLLSFLNTFVTFHCSFWLWWTLFLKIRDLNSCHDSCKNNVMQNCQDFQRC